MCTLTLLHVSAAVLQCHAIRRGQDDGEQDHGPEERSHGDEDRADEHIELLQHYQRAQDARQSQDAPQPHLKALV